MNSLKKHAAAAATLLLALASPAFTQVTKSAEIKTPALRSFTVVQPKRIALGNGMIIFLQEDHELPLIRSSAQIRGGERDVPAAKTGLANIYGQAWRTGGTDSKTGDQLDDFLESRAARIETSGGDDSTRISLDVLKGDFDTVFPVFVELLQKPAFRQEKIDLAKTQARTAISRRNDDPGLRRRLAVRPHAGVRDDRSHHARGPSRVSRPLRRAEQHHHRRRGRLRLRCDGKESPRRFRVMEARHRRSGDDSALGHTGQAGRLLRREG